MNLRSMQNHALCKSYRLPSQISSNEKYVYVFTLLQIIRICFRYQEVFKCYLILTFLDFWQS